MGQYVVGRLYRAGGHGLTLFWMDGSSTTYAARAVFRLEQMPSRAKGRAFRLGEPSSYERL